MNLDSIEASAPPEPAAGLKPGSRVRLILLLPLVMGGMGALAVVAGHALAKSAVVDLGPTDGAYARGFRDVERDGDIYFRWSSVPSSSVMLPVRFCGPGSLRLRLRRHFVDPALLSASISGAVVGQRTVSAGLESPYELIEFHFLKVACTSNATVLLESIVENSRPLGVAVDWIEIRSPEGFSAPPESTLRGALAIALPALALLLAGGSQTVVWGMGVALAALIGFSFAGDPVAGERILRGGLPALVLTLVIGAAIGRLVGGLRVPRHSRLGLIALTIAMVVSRSIFLNPQAFYPDYRVHALVLQTLKNSGFARFLDQIFEIQYARSLGLQQIDGNWYPFPYPPGSYLLAQGVSRASGLDAMDATLAMGIVAASLIPALTFALGVLLEFGANASLAGAFFVAFQPLLVRRMALGYFPGLAGQLVDALGLLLLVRLIRTSAPSRQRVLLTGAALLAGFLVYTQSIANFGLLIAGMLVAEVIWRRPGGLKAVVGVSLLAGLALAAAAGTFYWRYLPVLENVARHEPQPESRVLDRLDNLRRANPALAGGTGEDPTDDPFAGPTLNPARGFARLGSRLWRFNGLYAIAILIGFCMQWRQSDRGARNLLFAWGGVCVWISLLAAGLPSPNGFQHLKDLEFVSPLLALALGVLWTRFWAYRPTVAVAFAAGWLAFAGRAFVSEVADRLMVLAGR